MKWKSKILKLSPLLLIFLLLSIDINRPPEFVEIVLLLTPLLFILTTYLFGDKSKHRLPKNKFQILTLLFLLQLFVFVMSTFFTTNVIQSTYSLMRWVAIITTLIVLSKHTGRSTAKILSVYIQLLGTVYSLVFLATLILKIIPPSYLNTIKLAGEHHQLASLLVISIPLILSNLLAKKAGKNVTMFSKVALAINLVALTFTFARGAWLTLIFIPPLFLLVRKKPISYLSRHKLAIALTSLLVVIVVFLGLVNDFQGYDNGHRVTRNFTNLHQQSLNFKTRLNYYSQAFLRLELNPIWGTGLNTYTNSGGGINQLDGITSYTHNFLLQILTETGIFSALVFTTILIYVIFQLFITARNHPNSTNTGVFVAFILSFLYSTYDFNLNLSLVFLVIFSLAISVIYNSNNKKAYSLKKFNFLLNSFLVLCFIVLEVFIVAALSSTILYMKADRFNASSNYQKASSLYLNSLRMFPLNNSHFKQTINYLDNHFPEKSDEIIKKWIWFNHNNGDMYNFLTNRALDGGDYKKSLKYLNLSLGSRYEPAPDSKTIQRMLRVIGSSNQTIIDPNVIKFVSLFDDFILGQPAVYFNWPTVNFYYKIVVDLSQNPDLKLFSPQEQELILDRALSGYFILDTIDNSDEIISLLNKLIIMDPNNGRYTLYKKIVTELSSFEPSLKITEQLILELELSIQSSTKLITHRLLLSRLYVARSRHYQLVNRQDKELEYIDKAVQMSPLTASFRIYKINRLKVLGLLEESNQALKKCMAEISPLCKQWYLNSIL